MPTCCGKDMGDAVRRDGRYKVYVCTKCGTPVKVEESTKAEKEGKKR